MRQDQTEVHSVSSPAICVNKQMKSTTASDAAVDMATVQGWPPHTAACAEHRHRTTRSGNWIGIQYYKHWHPHPRWQGLKRQVIIVIIIITFIGFGSQEGWIATDNKTYYTEQTVKQCPHINWQMKRNNEFNTAASLVQTILFRYQCWYSW